MTTENKLQIASEKAEVMLSFDRGEKVESRFRGHKIWAHDSNPSWDWQRFEWRVMTKPVECWAWLHPDGTCSPYCYSSKYLAETVHIKYGGRAVFMREVI